MTVPTHGCFQIVATGTWPLFGANKIRPADLGYVVLDKADNQKTGGVGGRNCHRIDRHRGGNAVVRVQLFNNRL